MKSIFEQDIHPDNASGFAYNVKVDGVACKVRLHEWAQNNYYWVFYLDGAKIVEHLLPRLKEVTPENWKECQKKSYREAKQKAAKFIKKMRERF